MSFVLSMLVLVICSSSSRLLENLQRFHSEAMRYELQSLRRFLVWCWQHGCRWVWCFPGCGWQLIGFCRGTWLTQLGCMSWRRHWEWRVLLRSAGVLLTVFELTSLPSWYQRLRRSRLCGSADLRRLLRMRLELCGRQSSLKCSSATAVTSSSKRDRNELVTLLMGLAVDSF